MARGADTSETFFYANNSDGTFSDISGAAGLDFLEDGRAFALADFDHDGRQEVFLKNRNGPQLRILKNVVENLPPSISFRLRGIKSNCDAIGTVVTLETELGRQIRSLQAGSGFLSQHSKDVFFGLGAVKGPVQRFDSLAKRTDTRTTRSADQPPRVGGRRLRTISNGAVQDHCNVIGCQSATNRTTAHYCRDLAAGAYSSARFSLTDFAGQARTLSSLRGKPVLLNFWAAGAERSPQEWIAFNQHHATWATQGLQLFSVNLDDPGDGKRSRPWSSSTVLHFLSSAAPRK